MTWLGTFFRWLGHPFRALARGAMVLVNLDRRQMRSVFSLGMLGGIVALSFQNLALLFQAYTAHIAGQPVTQESLLGEMVLVQQFWNNAIMAGFATILGLVVWGADYLRAKFGEKELAVGRRAAAASAEEPLELTEADVERE